LTNISLRIFRGEIIGITGDNGSGKTTLLKLITGLLKPKEGEIRVNGKEIRSLNWNEITAIFGVVFQNPELQFFEETIEKELQLISKSLKLSFSPQDIDKLVTGSGLDKYARYNPHSLSHGEKRRLAFLSSIIHNPEVIILDEITNGLDETNKVWIVNHLLELRKKNKAIIVISHEWDWIKDTVDKVVLLEEGKISLLKNETISQDSLTKQDLGGDENHDSS
jgi:energy-coupling factor transporter ATP-binding protein EcfA2